MSVNIRLCLHLKMLSGVSKYSYTKLLSACIHAARASGEVIRSVVIDRSNVVDKHSSAVFDGAFEYI